MRYLRLLGILCLARFLALSGLATLSGLGCSASGDTKPPPNNASGGAYVGQGGTTSAAGGTVGTGGEFSNTGGMVPCTEPEKRCGSVCADTATSHEHCGDCNQPCGATQICVDGICSCPASNPDADAGPVTDYQLCAGKCVDILSDKTFCGACLGGEICLYDRCVGGHCGCLPTDITCGEHNECVDKLTDKNNCGGCGIKCGEFDDCEQGECIEHCEKNGGKMCGATCIDVTNNSAAGVIANCGDCGVACPTDKFECKAGQCVCRAASVLATVMHCVEPNTKADLCVDTATDTRFCGSCTNACELGKACQNGTCACSSTSLQCPDGCFDATSDSKHCGSCDKVCDVGYRCVASSCVCNSGLNLCADRCADYMTEPANCGGCGQACGAGQACTAGKCQCDAGLDLCAGSCFDLMTDAAHCGKCDNACSSSQTCVGGQCTCGDALLACDKTCVDAQNDALNCGGCNVKCSPTQMCQGGTCRTSIVKAQSLSTGEGGTKLRFSVGICNTSASAVNLTGYKLKYWYTTDKASTTQVAVIAWAPSPFTTGTNPSPATELLPLKELRECTTSAGVTTCKADAVLTLSFTGGSLAANICSGAIQIEINPEGWAGTYDPQTTDYSYIASTTLKDNQYITIYNPQGLIVWGVEPALPPPATTP